MKIDCSGCGERVKLGEFGGCPKCGRQLTRRVSPGPYRYGRTKGSRSFAIAQRIYEGSSGG